MFSTFLVASKCLQIPSSDCFDRIDSYFSHDSDQDACGSIIFFYSDVCLLSSCFSEEYGGHTQAEIEYYAMLSAPRRTTDILPENTNILDDANFEL